MTAPFRRRTPLVALIGANLVSTVGGAMSLVALPWLVYALTGDPAKTGIAAACEYAAVTVASLFAGSVVAVLGPRDTRVASDLVAGLAVLAIPVLYATIGIAYPILLVLVAVNGLLRTPAVAASFVLLARTARTARLSTETVSGPYLASLQAAQVVGAPAAGATIALVGAPWALVVDAGTFLVSGAAIRLFLPGGHEVGQEQGPSLRSAWVVLRSDRLLLRLIAVSFALSVALAGWGSVLAPVYGQTVLHSAARLATILTANGVGAMVGAAAAGRIVPHVPRRPMMTAATGCALVPPFVLIALQAPVAAVVGAMFVAGLGAGLFSTTFVTIEYERIPTADQGHVFGLVGGLGTAGVAVGPLLAGGLLSVAPLGACAAAIAAVGAAAALPVALAAGLRRPAVSPGPRSACEEPAGRRSAPGPRRR